MPICHRNKNPGCPDKNEDLWRDRVSIRDSRVLFIRAVSPSSRCRQQLIKSDRRAPCGCGLPSISVQVWKRGFGVLACYGLTISAGNLLSQVGLARNVASRVAMLLQSDKNQPEIRPPLGRRVETGRPARRGAAGGGTRAARRGRAIRPGFECTGANEPTTRRNSGRSLFRDLPRYSSGPSASTLHTFMQIRARTAVAGPEVRAKTRVGMQKCSSTFHADVPPPSSATPCYIR